MQRLGQRNPGRAADAGRIMQRRPQAKPLDGRARRHGRRCRLVRPEHEGSAMSQKGGAILRRGDENPFI